jgi:hypothetical protein
LKWPIRNGGRPINPYSSGDSRWKTGATLGLFDHLSGIAPSITWLLATFDVPVLRRVLEATLAFDHGYDRDSLTRALHRLRQDGYAHGYKFVRTQIDEGASGELSDVYSLDRTPTEAEKTYLLRACQSRNRLLNKKLLKDAGEKYFRAVLVESGSFSGITQKGRLGRCVDANGKNALDIIATDQASGRKFGISVKNRRECLFPGDEAVKDCYAKAKAHGAEPWLVVPFASIKAEARCERDGILLTVLGRRIVPAKDSGGRHMRNAIERLRSTIGPEPFDFLYERFRDTLVESPAARRDVENVIRQATRLTSSALAREANRRAKPKRE